MGAATYARSLVLGQFPVTVVNLNYRYVDESRCETLGPLRGPARNEVFMFTAGRKSRGRNCERKREREPTLLRFARQTFL